MVRAPDSQHRTLAEFLRTHRAKVSPSVRGRRRTPGLRREEVAELAGISGTWYTWMEQGRDVSVSPATLDRLAKALQLSAAERTYLFELAGKRDPTAPPSQAKAAPPDLNDVVAVVRTPAYVLDGLWNAVAWNRHAEQLFRGWLDGAHANNPTRNILRFMFAAPAARKLVDHWEDRCRRISAEFRADYAKRLDDPAMQALVDDLKRASKFFAETWEEHLVLSREGGERTFNLPTGLQSYRQSTFNFAARPEFKLVILTPLEN
jgi:transcriptional regulator with XRE-family HTH domain